MNFVFYGYSVFEDHLHNIVLSFSVISVLLRLPFNQLSKQLVLPFIINLKRLVSILIHIL